MPTGYTDSIKDGISFENFVLKCARNFGACIALRGVGGDVLPTIDNIQFDRDDYHETKLKNAESNLLHFENCSEEEWADAFAERVATDTKDAEDRIAEKKQLLKKYKEMLAKVEDWIPPTHDHVALKEFMKQQIVSSIDYDCNLKYCEERLKDVKNLTLQDFKDETIASEKWNIEYHSKYVREDADRNAKNVEWLQKLLDSLKQ